jgi:hypothetical protein
MGSVDKCFVNADEPLGSIKVGIFLISSVIIECTCRDSKRAPYKYRPEAFTLT